MLAGAAILPTAPLLVPGASATLPPGVPEVCDAIDATVERLPDRDVVVLLAGDQAAQVHGRAIATLAGIGRDDIVTRPRVDTELAERIAAAVDLPVVHEPHLPLDLAVLALLLGDQPAIVPVAVPPDGAFDRLVAVGASIAEVLEDRRGVLVAAGDLAAGLADQAPLHSIDGAGDFDAAVVEAVDAGRLGVLAKLGPGEAGRVGARGWAPLAVLHGALQAAKLGLVRRHYSAPRGVGYLVAHGA